MRLTVVDCCQEMSGFYQRISHFEVPLEVWE